jgi:hypothetical protein
LFQTPVDAVRFIWIAAACFLFCYKRVTSRNWTKVQYAPLTSSVGDVVASGNAWDLLAKTAPISLTGDLDNASIGLKCDSIARSDAMRELLV